MTEGSAVLEVPESGARRGDPVPAVVLGLGPVGQGVLRAAQEDPRYEVRACVDPRPDREDLAGRAGFRGEVYASVEEVTGGPGVGILCTQSTLVDVAPSIQMLLDRDYDVVTSCEEMIAPQLAPREIVREIGDAALRANRTVLGAGVNPGFVMDLLPMVATIATRRVEQVRILRRVDVGTRRQRLQNKVGMGISLDEFAERREAGAIGHVGLRASLTFVADALGWNGESAERVEPVVDWDGKTSRGVRHIAEVRDNVGTVRVRGLLEMYSGASEVDQIEVDGTPPAVLSIFGGMSGDEATISAILNVGARIAEMESGLKTLADVPPPAWRNE